MRNIITILAIGVVLWWLISPTRNPKFQGVAFIAGLWQNATQFLSFLTTGK